MTKLLIRILFLAAVVGGGTYVVKQKQDSEIANNLNEFQGSVKGVTNNINDQAKELTSRGQEVGEHVSNILESYIKPTEKNTDDSSSESSTESNNSSNNQDKPIYEETLDYGRYLYCQQVIKDYDIQHP